MLGNLTGFHLIIILVVIILLFGAPKLPALARSLGQSMRIFKGEVKTMKEESSSDSRDDVRDADRRPEARDAARSTTDRDYVRPAESNDRAPRVDGGSDLGPRA